MRRFAYKLLNANGRSPYRDYPYRLPDGRRFGEWMETDGPVRLGSRGLFRCLQCGKPHNAYKWSPGLAPQWGDLRDRHPYYKEDPESLLRRLPKELRDKVLAA